MPTLTPEEVREVGDMAEAPRDGDLLDGENQKYHRMKFGKTAE